MIWVLPLLGLIGMEVVADVFAKEYSLRGGWFWFAAIASYIIANSFWLYSIKHGAGLARGASIFAISTGILATVVGVYFYKEHLAASQLVGIFLGIVALALIFWE